MKKDPIANEDFGKRARVFGMELYASSEYGMLDTGKYPFYLIGEYREDSTKCIICLAGSSQIYFIAKKSIVRLQK